MQFVSAQSRMTFNYSNKTFYDIIADKLHVQVSISNKKIYFFETVIVQF